MYIPTMHVLPSSQVSSRRYGAFGRTTIDGGANGRLMKLAMNLMVDAPAIAAVTHASSATVRTIELASCDSAIPRLYIRDPGLVSRSALPSCGPLSWTRSPDSWRTDDGLLKKDDTRGGELYDAASTTISRRSFPHPDPPRPRRLDREAAGGGREGSGGGHGGRIAAASGGMNAKHTHTLADRKNPRSRLVRLWVAPTAPFREIALRGNQRIRRVVTG